VSSPATVAAPPAPAPAAPGAVAARRDLVAAPAWIAALAAVGLFIVWETDSAAQAATTWLPGALLLTALLAICAWALPVRLATLPRSVAISLIAFAGYAAFSFLTILWARDQGTAWDGANRTLLYLVVYALFALWPQRPAGAGVVLGAYTLGIAGLALGTAIGVTGADASVDKLFYFGRLVDPTGYTNATACLFLMAVFPAAALSSSRRVPWPVRGLCAGAAVLLCDIALLCASRGAAIAFPLVVVLWFALFPDRVRRLAFSIPIAIGLAFSAPAMVRAGDKLYARAIPHAVLAHPVRGALVATVVVAIVVTVIAAAEAFRPPAEAIAARAHRAFGAVALAGAAVALVVGLIAIGSPTHRLSHAWHSFKGGYAERPTSSSRLTSGLGSGRYDFYRVSLDLFRGHPIGGVGADNFADDYLVRRRVDETPTYPHSLEMRTLAGTGIVGALLLLVALGAGVAAAWRGTRSREPLGRIVAIGALGTAIYWFVHASGDWFWEIPGLTAPALAMLGLAGTLGARRDPGPRRLPRPLRLGLLGAGAATLILVLLTLAAPWGAARDIDKAAHTWPQSPRAALDRLDQAAGYNPLNARAYLVKGAIQVRLNDLRGADASFAKALRRHPGLAYALLERGAIAATLGDRVAADPLLRAALARNPHDPYTQDFIHKLDAGHRVDVRRLNVALARAAQHFVPGTKR